VAVDPTTFRARPPPPCCPRCGALARPNILMFGDGGWEAARLGGALVRINVREPDTPPGHIGLPMAALAALTRIEALLEA
jgi:hypothetical protein